MNEKEDEVNLELALLDNRVVGAHGGVVGTTGHVGHVHAEI
jgi:hypothetical protein